MNYKKIAAVLAAATVLATASALAVAPYKDMNSIANPAAINYLYDCRCLNFVKSDTFLPNQVMTRGEVAQLLYDGMANYQQSTTWFKDIKSRATQDAVTAMVKRGIMQVYPDGSFHSGDPVTREEFAGMVYNYLKYYQLSDQDGIVDPYDDAASITPALLPMVQVEQSKHIMDTQHNLFRPKDGITRAEATAALYRMLKSDDEYVSHVAVETAVLKCISAEYGSPQAYFQTGTLYWQGDQLVMGMKGGPSKMLRQRLKEEVKPAGAVIFKKVKYSRADYGLLQNRVVKAVVKTEGVRNYIGAMPDYANEKLIVMVRRPIEQSVIDQINKTVGAGIVQFQAASEMAKTAGEQQAARGAIQRENAELAQQPPTLIPANEAKYVDATAKQ